MLRRLARAGLFSLSVVTMLSNLESGVDRKRSFFAVMVNKRFQTGTE